MNFWNRLKSWLRRKDSVPSGFQMIQGPDGRVTLVDQITLDYMESTAPAPTQESLDSVLKQLRKVRIYRGGCLGVKLLKKDVLLETESDEDLKRLSESLRIKDEPAGHCMCLGDPTIELLGEESDRLAIISVHHGHSIRWNQWKDDAELVNGLKLLNWLAERGVAYPLDEYEEDRRRAEVNELNWRRWVENMPTCLRPFKDEMKEYHGWVVITPAPDSIKSGQTVKEYLENDDDRTVGIDKLRKVMEEAYSDGVERALVLLAWLGNGAGPWSNFPVYEEVADKLILYISRDDLISALSRPDLSEAQIDGGARFLTGHHARSFRDSILALLSDDIKNFFLEHILRSNDEYKKKRASRIFSSKK